MSSACPPLVARQPGGHLRLIGQVAPQRQPFGIEREPDCEQVHREQAVGIVAYRGRPALA